MLAAGNGDDMVWKEDFKKEMVCYAAVEDCKSMDEMEVPKV